ncbi:hypothetical protein FN846DRAFT_914464 [Sphaerosporella brunnea]|uniref:Uncharacterized protein n=1 Tax=Sphaerosporella brunnea TaxID=1250544 RepID=A0A5J5EC08_9PEZI|nr:hypothetical protein FN846DRAFT_914464 [Sphaerosporella brunnea]
MADVEPPKKRPKPGSAPGDRSASSSDSATKPVPVPPPMKPSNTVTELPRKRPSGLRRTPVRPAGTLIYQVPKPELETAEEKTRRVTETLIREDEAAIAALQEEISRLERLHASEREKEEKNQKAMIARLLAVNDTSFSSLPAAPTFDFQAATADPNIPSALPLPAADPLPLLQAFSELTFTKSVVTVAGEAGGRHHDIAGYAGAAPTALGFRLSLLVSAENTVDALTCSVSRWARRELKGLMATCEQSRDPQLFLWAINTYQPLAVKRAKTLASLCWRYPSLLPQFGASAAKTKRRRGRVYKPHSREIVALLGESTLCFRQGPEFVLAWRVEVDDVGEAQSCIEGFARFPAAWSEFDTKAKALRNVPPLFDNLVRERGPYDGVRCMVEMLFPNAQCRK